MSDFKVTSKLKLVAIISAAIIVLGAVLGTVMHFTTGGFFNYDGEYSSYKQVSVVYYWQEITSEDSTLDIDKISKDAFAANGIKSYISTEDVTSGGTVRVITYRFTLSTSTEAIEKAAGSISDSIGEFAGKYTDIPMSYVSSGEVITERSGGWPMAMAAVVLACIVAVHMIYTLIRYGLTGMCAAFVADLHNLALFASLLAICRIPITSAVLVVDVLVILATVVCTTLLFDRIKRVKNESENKPLTAVVDESAAQIAKNSVAFNALFCVAAVLAFALMAISSLSPLAILPQSLCVLAAFAATGYGVALFVPAIYPALYSLCGKINIKKQKPAAQKTTKEN